MTYFPGGARHDCERRNRPADCSVLIRLGAARLLRARNTEAPCSLRIGDAGRTLRSVILTLGFGFHSNRRPPDPVHRAAMGGSDRSANYASPNAVSRDRDL